MNLAYGYYNRIKKLLKTMHSDLYNEWEKRMKRYYERLVDSADEDLEELIEKIKNKHMIDDALATSLAEDMIRKVRLFGIKQVDNQIESIAGINPTLRYPRASERINLIIKENVRLIKELPNRYFNEVERVIRTGVLEGKNINEIRSGLSKASNKTISNAKLVARDQVGSTLAEITRQRQEQANIEHYIWRSTGDDRVRDNHEEWDGQRFSWREGSPNGTHPGQEIQCRCIAEPDSREVKKEWGEA